MTLRRSHAAILTGLVLVGLAGWRWWPVPWTAGRPLEAAEGARPAAAARVDAAPILEAVPRPSAGAVEERRVVPAPSPSAGLCLVFGETQPLVGCRVGARMLAGADGAPEDVARELGLAPGWFWGESIGPSGQPLDPRTDGRGCVELPLDPRSLGRPAMLALAVSLADAAGRLGQVLGADGLSIRRPLRLDHGMHLVRVDEGGFLFGRVLTGAWGTPVRRERITFAWSGEGGAAAEVEAQVVDGSFRVVCPVRGRLERVTWRWERTELVHVPAVEVRAEGGLREYDVLFPQVGDALLTFVDAQDGTPVQGVELRWIDAADPVSDELGRVKVPRAFCGDEGLTFRADAPGYPWTIVSIQPEPGALVVEQVVELERGGTVAGRVVDARGEPMAEVGVSLALDPCNDVIHMLSGFGRSAMTDAEGRFTLEGLLPDSSYELRLAPPAPPGSEPDTLVLPNGWKTFDPGPRGQVRELHVADGEQQVELVYPDMQALEGSVVIADGSAAADAHVWLHLGRLCESRSSLASATGWFRFERVWPARWTLSASSESGWSSLDVEVLPEGPAPVRLVLPVLATQEPAPAGALAWRLVVAGSGEAVADDSVGLRFQRERDATGLVCAVDRRVDSPRGWALLPPGRYRVSAYASGFVGAERSVEVPGPGELVVELERRAR